MRKNLAVCIFVGHSFSLDIHSLTLLFFFFFWVACGMPVKKSSSRNRAAYFYSSGTSSNCNVPSIFARLFFPLNYILKFYVMIFFIQQNNLFKAREEKFQSRIRVLEALASNINEENQVLF